MPKWPQESQVTMSYEEKERYNYQVLNRLNYCLKTVKEVSLRNIWNILGVSL